MCVTTRPWIHRIIAVAVFCVYFGTGQSVRAGTLFSLTITNVPPAGDAYNGQWVFEVSLNAAKDMVELTVVSGNNEGNTNDWKGVKYSYAATENNGNYTFSGTSLGTRTPPPPESDYNLGVSGVFNPTTCVLTITNPVTSQLKDGTGPVYEFTFTKITAVPEPSSSVLGVTALGILGAGLALKRRPDGERTANGDAR